MDIVIAIDDILGVDEALVQGQGRIDAANHHLIERPAQTHDTFVPGAAMDNELADHRVVIWWYAVTRIGRTVDPHVRAAWRMKLRDNAG